MQGGKRRDFSQTIPDERRDLSVRKAVHLLYGKKGIVAQIIIARGRWDVKV
jgi:hypothetical protein